MTHIQKHTHTATHTDIQETAVTTKCYINADKRVGVQILLNQYNYGNDVRIILINKLSFFRLLILPVLKGRSRIFFALNKRKGCMGLWLNQIRGIQKDSEIHPLVCLFGKVYKIFRHGQYFPTYRFPLAVCGYLIWTVRYVNNLTLVAVSKMVKNEIMFKTYVCQNFWHVF